MKAALTILLLLFITTFLLLSCSKRVLEAKSVYKLHDEYLILRKNGHYSHKILMLGIFKMPDAKSGKYVISNDSVYFIEKQKGNIYYSRNFGIIDTASATFFYYESNDLRPTEMFIEKMPGWRKK